MNIAFERPLLAILAVFSPLIIMLLKNFFHSAFNLNLSFGAPEKKKYSFSLRWFIFLRTLKIMEYTSVVLLLLASSCPQIIKREIVWLDRGSDIVFVLDCSPSMAGIDMNGENRFNASKKLIHNFATNRPSDSVGLIAVGIDAAVLVPPTIDRTAFLNRLDLLQIGELGDGTALGMGLSLAALHLHNSSANQKAVILITDGENNAGAIHPSTAALALHEENVDLYIIGIGRSGDIPIDYVDPVTKVRRAGTFESKFSGEVLEKLAIEGNGIYLNAPSSEAFSEAFAAINKREANVSRGSYKENRKNINPLLLWSALIMLITCRFIKKYIFGSFL
ncbi:aerotolerance regulator BatA [Spirochaetia bacterium]|nr:aerotolerance regulator BatA [Spirochaetia bacterium]